MEMYVGDRIVILLFQLLHNVLVDSIIYLRAQKAEAFDIMPTSPSKSRAQEHLLLQLVFLAQCGASWFKVNGDTSNGFSSVIALAFAMRLVIIHFFCMAAWLAMKLTKKQARTSSRSIRILGRSCSVVTPRLKSSFSSTVKRWTWRMP